MNRGEQQFSRKIEEDEMKSPERITIALDEETAGLFKKMKEDSNMSQSELMRESLKFFGKHKLLFGLYPCRDARCRGACHT